MGAKPRMSLLFDAIAAYCERQDWVPVGFRRFDVGPWRFTMNGTKTERDGVPPYHCAIDREDDAFTMILVQPFGGGITGVAGRDLVAVEDEIIATLRQAGAAR